ncbi:bifunctional hydroxymethylpyrimidine kinase/phosphomethylpyrimidine kinase [Streptococcus caballi]|uniref:bifunctional hydroxymethylpyrimidine kinase/phosphomethylpyrimidine kinase n=1 Tax=Streptococcus caballi TaxID=439220 RepID=UPI00037B0E39|nr:bifunctional hydroxymethylpyrimidine kinase/phosphomethylpyrimidine kinase [Streptococcus caballi]
MKTDYILAISGNDVLSGGGMQADLATFTVSGLYGFVAQTCMTSIKADGFEITPTPAPLFAKQLESLREVPFAAIKLGLLPSVEIAEQALGFLQNYGRELPVVFDPVLVFKENSDQANSGMRVEMLKFLPLATVITPNLREAAILSGMPLTTLSDMKKAAQILYDLGAQAIVIKGGSRLNKHEAIDLFYDGQDFVVLRNPILHRNNNGAGCTFAAYIASQLALGKESKEAVSLAKDFVYHTIEESNDYGVKQNYAKNKS